MHVFKNALKGKNSGIKKQKKAGQLPGFLLNIIITIVLRFAQLLAYCQFEL